MTISFMFFSLLTGVSVFTLMSLRTIPYQATGPRFFRLIFLLCFLLFFPFLPFHPFDTFRIPFRIATDFSSLIALVHIAFLIYCALLAVLFVLYFRKTPSPLVFKLTILVGILSLFLEGLLYRPSGGTVWWENIIIPLSFMSGAFLVGSSLFAMMLGHWYLVQFDLDKKLLKRVSLLFSVALALRIVTTLSGLLLFSKSGHINPDYFHSIFALNGHGIFFWMRVIIGFALPLMLAYMIYETARLGANQSCTGLLYIAVVFVFMGEMVSRYVFFLKGIPL